MAHLLDLVRFCLGTTCLEIQNLFHPWLTRNVVAAFDAFGKSQ